jgi:hypothetical protein
MMAMSASLKDRSPRNRQLNVCRAGSGRMQSPRHRDTARLQTIRTSQLPRSDRDRLFRDYGPGIMRQPARRGTIVCWPGQGMRCADALGGRLFRAPRRDRFPNQGRWG